MGSLDLIETETGLACIGDESLTGLKDQHVVLKIGVPLWDSKFGHVWLPCINLFIKNWSKYL